MKLQILSIVVIFCLFLTVQAQASLVFYGVNSNDDGLSRIDPETAEVTFIGPLNPDPNRYVTPVAMTVMDLVIYVWNNSDEDISTGVLLTVDPFTGLATPVDPGEEPQGSLGALASDGERLYGAKCVYDYSVIYSELVEIDPETGHITEVIGDLGPGIRIAGMDFDNSGNLYGLTLTFDTVEFGTINTSTGGFNVIAELELGFTFITGSIVFNPETGVFIASGRNQTDNESIFFDIDPSNGNVSNIRQIFGGSGPQGMGFICPDCDFDLDNVPNHVDNCPYDYNPGQEDQDSDGIGDVCDNQPPIANADGPYIGNEGSAITFDASASYDPDGDLLQYRWDFNNDGIWDTGWLTDLTTSYTWGDDWSGTAKLEVSDGELNDIDIANVTVVDEGSYSISSAWSPILLSGSKYQQLWRMSFLPSYLQQQKNIWHQNQIFFYQQSIQCKISEDRSWQSYNQPLWHSYHWYKETDIDRIRHLAAALSPTILFSQSYFPFLNLRNYNIDSLYDIYLGQYLNSIIYNPFVLQPINSETSSPIPDSQPQYVQADYMLTPSYNGGSGMVEKGDTISIVLQSDATTGYLWYLDEDELDEDVISYVGRQYYAATSTMVGTGGSEQWLFEAEGAGDTTIRLEYKQPGSTAVSQTFTVDVEVTD